MGENNWLSDRLYKGTALEHKRKPVLPKIVPENTPFEIYWKALAVAYVVFHAESQVALNFGTDQKMSFY